MWRVTLTVMFAGPGLPKQKARLASQSISGAGKHAGSLNHSYGEDFAPGGGKQDCAYYAILLLHDFHGDIQ